jgi:hypothetical protein
MQRSNVEKGLSFIGHVGAAVLETMIERAIVALIGAFSAEHLKILMDHNYYVIETVLNATKRRPNYEKYNFTPEQIKVLEARRLVMIKRALGVIGMIKSLTSRFPEYREQLTIDNVRDWLMKHRPEIMATIDAHPNKMWLQNQINEIKRFFWGY